MSLLCRKPCNGNNIILRRCSQGVKPNVPNKDRLVGSWLFGCCGMVFTAVVLGGATYYYVTYYSVETILDKALDPASKKY